MQDLFETPELLPVEVQSVLSKWEDADPSYDNCQQLVEDLERVGYTCSYGLDAVPYDLKKNPSRCRINQKSSIPLLR